MNVRSLLICLMAVTAQAQFNISSPFYVPSFLRPASGYDSDAQDYFDRVAAVGATLTLTEKNAVNAWVLNAKSDAYWSNLKEFNPHLGSAWPGPMAKLKYDPALAPSTNTPVLLDSGDYVSDGIRGDGVGYLSTGLNVNEVGSNIGLSVWLANDDLQAAGSGILIGSDFTGDADERLIWFFGGTFFINQQNPIGPNAFSFSSGLYHILRGHSSSNTFLINGIPQFVESTSSSTARNADITILAGTAGTLVSTQTVSCYGVDDGAMGLDKAAKYATNTMALIRAVGRRHPSPFPMRYVPFIGQSRAIGYNSGAAISEGPDSGNNRMPFDGVNGLGNTNAIPVQANFPRLREIHNAFETIAGGWATNTTNHTFSSAGLGGAEYQRIKQGTTPYTLLTNNAALAAAQSVDYAASFGIKYIAVLHGETDLTNGVYADNMLTLRTNVQADLQAVTGLANEMVFIHSQPASWTYTNVLGVFSNAVTPLAMIAASKADPAHHVVFPTYSELHQDLVHPTNTAYFRIGQSYCEVEKMVDANTWTNFIPTNITRSGTTVTLYFSTTNHLVEDTTIVAAAANKGFNFYTNGSNAIAISAVVLSAESTITNIVTLTLGTTPATGGGGLYVGYADRGTNAYGGFTFSGASQTHGPRGNIRKKEGTLPHQWVAVFKESSP